MPSQPNIYLLSSPAHTPTSTPTPLSELNFAPVDHTSIQPPFDLVYQIIHNPSAFGGEAYLSISSVPDWVLSCIDRLRSRDDLFSFTPSQSAIIKACVCNGVEDFRNHPTIMEFKSLLHRARQIPNEHPLIIEEVTLAVKQLRVSPNASLAVGKSAKETYRISMDTKSAIDELKATIGIEQYKISIYSIIFTLASQPYITNKYRRLLKETIDGLIDRIYIKNKIGKKTLDGLDEETLAEIEKGIT